MSAGAVLRLGDPGGFEIGVADIGASWLSCCVPMGTDGTRREVLLSPADPWAPGGNRAYIGCTVGRVANRIAGSSFELEGRVHQLIANEGRNQLHGGPGGFHSLRWSVLQASRDAVRFGLVSQDGDQGFPGRVTAAVDYRVDVARRAVAIEFTAEADAITPVALTNHAYFNLDGNAADIRGHRLRVAASALLPVDDSLIPLDHTLPVDGTPMDLRALRPVPCDPSAHPQLTPASGLDHCYLLDAACRSMALAAVELASRDEALTMRLFTDQPGLQVYTGQHLAGLPGRGGRALTDYAGMALEPQAFPDSINRPAWRDSVLLRPGEISRRRMELVFAAN